MKKKYFHICSTENSEQILEEGLIANSEGYIFMLDSYEYADVINHGQLGHGNYTIIEIDSKGIKGNIINDRVAEHTASSQFICLQEKIEPKFLKRLLDKEMDYFKTALDENIRIFNMDSDFKNKSYLGKLNYLYSGIGQSNPKFGSYIKEQIEKLKN